MDSTTTTGLSLNYSRRDATQILADLKQQIPAVFPAWTDLSESDIGFMIIKAMIAVLDLSQFSTDAQVAETFLSLCQLRESAIRRAKELDYVPKQAEPATVSVQISSPAFNTEIFIPSGATWLINNIAFINADPIIIPQGQTSLKVTLTQGSSFVYNVTSPGTPFFKITLPQNASNIQVFVNGVLWNQIDSFIGAAEQTSYKVYEDVTGQIVCFGANQSTFIPTAGSQIVINAVITQGSKGNIEPAGQRVTLVSNLTDNVGNTINTTITGTTLTSALGGQDVESIDSIRQNAPAIYATQGRAVTAADYTAIVNALPGVSDAIAIGGETVGKYGDVLITAYGDDPYTVSPDLLAMIYNYLSQVNVVTVTPVVNAPLIVECQLSVNLGIDKTVYNDPITGQNLVNNAISTYFRNLKIGSSMYQSQLAAAVQAVDGIIWADFIITTDTFANSNAGGIIIPLYNNTSLSSVTLIDAVPTTLFSGNGTPYLNTNNNTFVYLVNGLTDQKVTLHSTSKNLDILVAYNQLIVLTNLTLASTLV